MSSRDHYHLLGIARDADRRTIEKAYRRRVRVEHPDVNKTHGAFERFRAVQEAYETLRDPVRRAEYDRWLDPVVATGHRRGSETGSTVLRPARPVRRVPSYKRRRREQPFWTWLQMMLMAVNVLVLIGCVREFALISQIIEEPTQQAMPQQQAEEPPVEDGVRVSSME